MGTLHDLSRGRRLRRYVALASMALTCACASTQAALHQPPREVINSAKSQAEVAFCIASKNSAAVLDAPDGAKVITISNGMGAGIVFSIYAEGSGSRTEIRKPVSTVIAIHKQCY